MHWQSILSQAYHWCPDYDAASTEFSRILKPNGTVAFIWNLEDRSIIDLDFDSFRSSLLFYRDGARWASEVRDVIEVQEQGTPQFRHMYWRQTFDTQSYQREFNPPEENTWTYKLQADKEIVVDRASSKSYVAVLPDDKKAEVQEEIRKIVDQGLDRVWIDETQGLFEYPYKTWAVIAHKK